MIRINLAPDAAKHAAPKSAGSSRLWGGIYLGASLVLIAIFAALYLSYQTSLEQQRRANQDLQTRIETLNSTASGLEAAQAALEKSQQLEATVEELNRARTGPVRVVMEINRILSRCPADQPTCDRAGPTIDPEALEAMRRENPYATYNRSWDVRRLWLTSFEETNRVCHIRGFGRTNDDVAEFLRRLSLSELFTQVALTRTAATQSAEAGVELIKFELSCQVAY